MPTVFIETYGCQMNVSDSELMLGKLAAEGYTAVDSPEGADVVLLNTCAIREHAETRVIGRLGELRRFLKKDAVLGVTGFENLEIEDMCASTDFGAVRRAVDRMLDVARLGLDEEAVDDRTADLGKDLEVDPQSQQGE